MCVHRSYRLQPTAKTAPRFFTGRGFIPSAGSSKKRAQPAAISDPVRSLPVRVQRLPLATLLRVARAGDEQLRGRALTPQLAGMASPAPAAAERGAQASDAPPSPLAPREDAVATSAEGTDCDESGTSAEEPEDKQAGAKRPLGATEGERAAKRQATEATDDDDEVVGESSEDVDMEANAEAGGRVEGPGEFHKTLEPRQQVDVFDTSSKSWLAANVVAVADGSWTVHYIGWNKAQDEEIGHEQYNRIARRGSAAAEQWADHEAKLQRRKRNHEARQTAEIAAPAVERSLAATDDAPFVEAGLTRSGRKITKRLTNDGAARRSTPKPASKKSDDGPTEQEMSGMPEDDLCGICGEIEDEQLSDMLLCDGGCLKSYHFSCLGIESAPENEKWLCEQCRNNEQVCLVCGRNATINGKGGVFRCSVGTCGRFYHQSCIDANHLSRRQRKPKIVVDEDDIEHEVYDFDATFKCPRHICSVCENPKKGSDIMCCLKCPESYHPYCVPPSARYNSVGLICSKHPECQLPTIPSFYLDAVTVDMNLRLPMLFVPKDEPDADDRQDHHHFRLLLEIVESVKQQPPTFHKLGRNLYTFKQPKESLEDVPMCECRVVCGDDCINRLSFTECFGPALLPNAKIDKNTKESNCRLGENCGNRALHQKTYPKFKQFHTIDKGWALKIEEPVKAGRLVIEYVGEVINEEEKERRLQHHAKFTPEDKNMYIMELGKGEYIDARFKGSVSRFINHSCDPNCHLVKWNVKGVNRIAITALRDIEAGEELSYDYQFHTNQAMEWKCHCKSKNCRGTMAPERIKKSAESPPKKLTKKEQAKKLKRALMQEKINVERESKSTARRLSLTAQVSMGNQSVVNKAVVRQGPASRELDWAMYNNLFLRRNARCGFDFMRRKELKDKKIAKRSSNGQTKSRKSQDGLSESTASSRSVSPVRTTEERNEEPAQYEIKPSTASVDKPTSASVDGTPK